MTIQCKFKELVITELNVFFVKNCNNILKNPKVFQKCADIHNIGKIIIRSINHVWYVARML